MRETVTRHVLRSTKRIRVEFGEWRRSLSAQRSLGRRIDGSSAQRHWIAVLPVLLMLKQRVPGTDAWVLPVRAQGAWHWVGDWSELVVVAEIFGQPPEYAFHDLPATAETILDLGANVGLAARWFSTRYPSARIISCEPDPVVVRRSRRNLSRCPNVSMRSIALGASAGVTPLWRFPGESWRGTTMSLSPEQSALRETVDVDVVTLDDLIEECGGHVTLAKMDIEGAEYEVIAASRRLEQIDYVIGEIHPRPDVSTERFLDLFSGFEILERRDAGEQTVFLARRRDLAPR